MSPGADFPSRGRRFPSRVATWAASAATRDPPPGLVGAALGLPAVALTVARGVARGPASVSGDPVYFLASGWSSAGGEVVYLYTWDVKPPGIHLVAWATAAVAGSPATYYHLLLALLAAVTLAAFALADGVLRSYDAGLAGRAAGGLALLAYPPVHRLPMYGPYAKVFVLALALGAVLALRLDRPLACGACATAAAAFWQEGALVAGVALAATAVRGDRRAVARFAAGGAAVAALAVGPVVIAGAGRAMVTQVVLAPLVHERTLAASVAAPTELLGLPAPVLGAALAGLAALAVRGGPDQRAYVAVAAGFVAVAALGQASGYDRVLYAGLLAVPAGVAVGRLPGRAAPAAVAVLVLVVAGVAPPLSGAPEPRRSPLEAAVFEDRDTSCHVYRSRYARALEKRYPRLVKRGDECANPSAGQVLGVLADVVTGSVPPPDGDWGGGPDPVPAVDAGGVATAGDAAVSDDDYPDASVHDSRGTTSSPRASTVSTIASVPTPG